MIFIAEPWMTFAEKRTRGKLVPGNKLDQPAALWDRLFAPSSCLAVITTIDAAGRVNAASYGTCTRVHHNPMYIAFTCNSDRHTAQNLEQVDEFVVNLPAFDRESLEKVRVVGLPFAKGVNELEKAHLTEIASRTVRPPRIREFPRHFECTVEWTKDWSGVRRMVVGKVKAASVDADCVDANGFLDWNRVKPAHFCGAPCHNMFVGAFETMTVDVPYDGPEVEAYNASEHAMFEGL